MREIECDQERPGLLLSAMGSMYEVVAWATSVALLQVGKKSVVLVKTRSAFFCNLCSDIVDENAAA